jgi:hypothetical protein
MNGVEAKLAQALHEVASAYRPAHAGRAQESFVLRRRRRRAARVVAAAGGLAVVVTLAALGPNFVASDVPVQGDPGVPPGDIAFGESIPVGTAPLDVSVGRDAVLVAHAEGEKVFVVDPDRREVRMRIPSGGTERGPTSIALGNGRLFGVDAATARLTSYDQQSGLALHEVGIGPQPTDIAFGALSVWVASSDPDGPADAYVVSRYDATSLELVGRFDVPAIARLEYGYGHLWAATSRGLYRLDPHSGRVVRVGRVESVSDASAGFGSVWAYATPGGGGFEGAVVKIAPDTARVLGRTPVRGFFGNVEAHEGTGLWVLSSVQEYVRRLHRLDPRDGRPLGEPLRVEGGLVEIAPGLGGLWLTDEARSRLRLVEVRPAR